MQTETNHNGVDVKKIKSELTKTNHIFGWLLTVLQMEDSDSLSMRQTLVNILSYLDTVEQTDTTMYRKAVLYIFFIILFKRTEEQEELVELINTRTQKKRLKISL